MMCHRQAGRQDTMNEVPSLYYGSHSSAPTQVFMIQAAYKHEGHYYPGLPVGIFYDYYSAKSAFDAYQDPIVRWVHVENEIVAFLTTASLNSRGILLNTRVIVSKLSNEFPANPAAWAELERG